MPDQRGPGLLGRSARGRKYASCGSGVLRFRHTSRHVPPGTCSKPPTYHSHLGGCEARRAGPVRTNPPSAEASHSWHSSMGSSSSDGNAPTGARDHDQCKLYTVQYCQDKMQESQFRLPRMHLTEPVLIFYQALTNRDTRRKRPAALDCPVHLTEPVLTQEQEEGESALVVPAQRLVEHLCVCMRAYAYAGAYV